jgi:hypothetical protein
MIGFGTPSHPVQVIVEKVIEDEIVADIFTLKRVK